MRKPPCASGRAARTRARTARPRAGKIRGSTFTSALNHVREYNQAYNFFQGMNADAGARYRRSADRPCPTWKMGADTGGKKGKRRATFRRRRRPFHMFPNSMAAAAGGRPRAEAKAETRKVMNAERKALQVMGLTAGATIVDVKAKYEALVKQHHPDANGGDRSTEDRLIEIIKAYNYLKTVVSGE